MMDGSFYTLSSGGEYTTDDTPSTPPSPTTHDTSKTSYHISDIASFAESLQDAANQAFPNQQQTRYRNVHVCLIRWEEDDLQVKHELDTLYDIFQDDYGFSAEIWLIPSTSPQIKLTTMACNFLQQHDEKGNLFIVYYGGHGTINAARQNQWWCRASRNSPYVDWSAIQTLFGTAASDVLILLDCCAAASSAAVAGSGTMEVIAACGWETLAPPPGPYSFTHTLIDVLVDWSNKPSFSAAMLHTEVLFVLKQKVPQRRRDGRIDWCSTPIHWVYTSDPKAPGIQISSFRREASAAKTIDPDPLQQPRSTTYMDVMDIDEEPDSGPLHDCTPDGDYKVPHVLISIALEGNQGTLDAAACRRWLAEFPALAKYANVEGVYRSYSTLVTLSVPVMVWDLLPNHPACSFVGYITSPNKNIPETPKLATTQLKTSLLPGDGGDVADSSYGSQINFGPNQYTALSTRRNSIIQLEPEAPTKDVENEVTSRISPFASTLSKETPLPQNPLKSLIAEMIQEELKATRLEEYLDSQTPISGGGPDSAPIDIGVRKVAEKKSFSGVETLSSRMKKVELEVESEGMRDWEVELLRSCEGSSEFSSGSYVDVDVERAGSF